MSAEFFALALIAAVNPSLLGVDLVLLMNRRPRAMLLCVLLGGLGIAITIGLIDVLLIRANFVKSESGLGPGAQVAIGVLLLCAGTLLMFGNPFTRRSSGSALKKPVKVGTLKAEQPRDDQPRDEPPTGGARKEKKPSWTERTLREPRLALGVLVGVVLGLPGALYLAAMHKLAAGTYSTLNKVVAVCLFAIIEFALVIIPLILLATRPEQTAAQLERWHKWLLRHGRKLGGWILLALGTYLCVSGLISLG
jgi:hypothetical protein